MMRTKMTKIRMMMFGMAAGVMMMAAVPVFAEKNPEMAGAYEAYKEEGMPEDAREVFDKAMEKYEGAEKYTPIQLAETQIVAGMNYRILCDKQEKDAPAQKVMLTIYKDLNGNCEVTMEQKVITPTNQKFDTEIQDFTTKAGFEARDFNWDDQTLTFKLYDTALYDMVDMSRLEPGSVIEVDGNYVTVDTIEKGEDTHRSDDGTEERAASLLINKGRTDEAYFVAYEGGCWINKKPDGAIAVVKNGEMTLPFADGMKFTDATGDSGESKEIEFGELKDYMEGMKNSEMGQYGPQNTTIEVKNGEIVSIVRA